MPDTATKSGQFVKVSVDLLQRTDITATTKIVVSYIVDCMRGKSSSWPGVQTIADRVGVSVGTVKRTLKAIESASLLRIEHGDPGKRNRYFLPEENRVQNGTSSGTKIDPLGDSQTGIEMVPGGIKMVPELVSKRTPKQTKTNQKTRKRASADPWKFAIGCFDGQILETEPFKSAWLEWIQYRRESKKPLTESSMRQQIRTLESWGVERAIRAIQHTIFKGWQGLREPESGDRVGRAEAKPGKYDNIRVIHAPPESVPQPRSSCRTGS